MTPLVKLMVAWIGWIVCLGVFCIWARIVPHWSIWPGLGGVLFYGWHMYQCGQHNITDKVRKAISGEIMNGRAPIWLPVRETLEGVLIPK